jgi:hypothetical protein
MEGMQALQKGMEHISESLKEQQRILHGVPGMEDIGLVSLRKQVIELSAWREKTAAEQGKTGSLWNKYKDFIVVMGVVVAVLKAFGVL